MKYRVAALSLIVLAALAVLSEYTSHIGPQQLLPYAGGLLVALVAAYLTTFVACSSIGEGLAKGAVEGLDKADPALVKKIDKKIDELPTDELKKAAEELKHSGQNIDDLTEQLKKKLKDHDPDIDEFLKGLGAAGHTLRTIDKWIKTLDEILEGLKDDYNKMMLACIYFFLQLAKKIDETEKWSEFLAYLIYLTFRDRLQKAIDKLKSTYWWLRFLASVL
ncbi:MAG TPA: hypothetical protein VLY24_00875 [Bryobacteraceae bacterium]|nr:hypothetical protein [Bryobacteraceae bacterium]